MSWERALKLLAVAVGLVLAEYYSWAAAHDVTIALYLLLLTPVIAAWWLDLPDQTSLGVADLNQIEATYGSYSLGKTYPKTAKVADLGTQLHVKNYFVADWLEETSIELVQEVRNSFPYKIVGYTIYLLILFGAATPEHSEDPAKFSGVKLVGTMLLFMMPLLIDWFLWRKQRTLNTKLKMPRH